MRLTATRLSFRRRIATVFQEPLLLNASVYDNAALGLKLRNVDSREIERRLRPWLERLGISRLASRTVRTLSGGEAQRTSLARALVLDPELLLLDEPFSALDQPSRDVLLDDLQEILQGTGTTTVFVTHDRNEAFRVASRIGVMAGGELLQLGRRPRFSRARSPMKWPRSSALKIGLTGWLKNQRAESPSFESAAARSMLRVLQSPVLASLCISALTRSLPVLLMKSPLRWMVPTHSRRWSRKCGRIYPIAGWQYSLGKLC